MNNDNAMQLNNPPITEALIEVRWPKAINLTDSVIKAVSNHFKHLSTNPEIKNLQQATIDFKDKHKTNIKNFGPNQIIFNSKEKNLILNITKDRVVLSNVRSYQGWNFLYKEFIKLIPGIKDSLSITEINRVGVRYVNNLSLPNQNNLHFSEYLKLCPSVPDGIPNKVSGFFNRLIVNNPERKATSIITQALDHNRIKNSQVIPVIFDIDVIKAGLFRYEKPQLEEVLFSLREFKNEIFYSSLTEKCLELYK